MGRLLLALDLSTANTGYAVFDLDTHFLINSGVIKSKTRNLRTLPYPKGPLYRMQEMAEQIKTQLIDALPEIEIIAIEEVNNPSSRIGQKTLSGVHWILLNLIEDKIDKVRFKDSDGANGWRTVLGLTLTEQDKQRNKELRVINKNRLKGTKLKPLINKKHLACRYVTKYYGLLLNCDIRDTDGDIADAIGLGAAILKTSLSK
jgi:hypothetical protein